MGNKSEATWHGADVDALVESLSAKNALVRAYRTEVDAAHIERDAAVREVAALRAGVEVVRALGAGAFTGENGAREYMATVLALLADNPAPDPS